MTKKALLLCASHNDLGLIWNLRKLGYYIIVTGNISGLPGEKYADHFVKLDYSDKDAVLKLAKREKITAICQCCNDFGVYTASYVAEKLGLPGYDSYETTLLLHNKDKFKAFAKKNNLSVVESFPFSEEMEAIRFCKKASLPLIVKPVDASAGNGISKIISENDIDSAVHNAFSKTRQHKIVIERFLTGSQHGFCTFLVNRKVIACCSNNEYSILNPYRVEIDTWPAETDGEFRELLIRQIEKIASLLHLKDGIFHLQYIVESGKPYIIEVMRRVLGNMYGIPAGMLTNFNWDYWETRAKCGLSCEAVPRNCRQEGFFAYKTILADRNGIISSIQIPDILDKFTLSSFMLKKPGDRITNYLSQPVGFLFLQFASQSQMKKILLDQYLLNLVTVKEEFTDAR